MMGAEPPDRRLRAALPEIGRWSRAESLPKFLGLLRQVQALHAERIHGNITWETVTVDAEGRLLLGESRTEVPLGGPNANLDLCPPELQDGPRLVLPLDLTLARETLLALHHALDPRRVDLYQLGTLLYRLISGKSIATYLCSPAAKGELDPALARFIDRALGHNPADRFANVREMADELRVLINASPGLRQSIPNQLGPYQLGELLGRGGMGEVYRGRDPRLDRVVAIKVLPQELARQPEFVRRFYAEATAAARVVHSNIVQIYDIGEDQGWYYFAMQFIEGENLGELLDRRGSLPAPETVPMVLEVLEGLAVAHRAGLVHRDIKPGNILIDRQTGRVLLVDFGLARSLGESRHTATGVILGTVDYLSPEQGRGGHVDTRSDLYSVGVLLYRMLSGCLPFTAESPTAMIFQHAYECPRPLTDHLPDLAPSLVRIVERLLSKKPELRHQTADELASDLRVCLAAGKSEPIVVAEVVAESNYPGSESPSRPSTFEPDWPTRRLAGRKWLRTFLGRRLAAYLPKWKRRWQGTQQIVDDAVLEYESRCHDAQRVLAEAEEACRLLLEQQRGHAEAAQQAAQRRVGATDPFEAENWRLEQESSERTAKELDTQWRSYAEEVENLRVRAAQLQARLTQLRNERDALKARLRMATDGSVGKAPRSRSSRRIVWGIAGVVLGTAGVMAILFSLELVVARIRAYRNVTSTWNNPLATDLPEPLNHGYDQTSRQPNQTVPASFDSSRLGTVVPLRQLIGHETAVSDVLFAGNRQLLSAAGAEIRVWDVETGHELRQLVDEPFTGYYALTVSRDGALVAAAKTADTHRPNSVCIWNLSSAQVLQRMCPGVSTWQMVFHPSSHYLAAIQSKAGDRRPVLAFWDADTGNRLVQADTGQLVLGNLGTQGLACTADGKRWAFPVEPAGVCIWDFDNRSVVRAIEIDLVHGVSLAFDPTGDLLATSGISTLRGEFYVPSYALTQVWDLRTGNRIGTYQTTSSRSVSGVRWTPDGRFIVVATQEGIWYWDATTGLPHQLLRGQSPASISLSDDGELLAAGGRPFGVDYPTGKNQPYILLWKTPVDSPVENRR